MTTRKSPEGLLLTHAAVAEELGISRETLRRWRKANCAPPRVRIGKRFYFTQELLDSWLRSRPMT